MGTYSNRNNVKPTLEDLVSKTKQEISSEEEEVIRLHVFEILNLLGREDVSKAIEKIIPEMDHDGIDNFNKIAGEQNENKG